MGVPLTKSEMRHTADKEFSRLDEVAGAEEALFDLCRPFVQPPFRPECVVVHPDALPYPADQLLVHHEHMTRVLQRHHGSPVEVHVLDERLTGDTYTRKITLTPRGQNKVVELGICRLDLRYISPAARDEILAKNLPLGAILIKHNVHRRIKPRYFLRFPEDGQVLRMYGEAAPPEPAYGRLGTIFCNGQPAIELLEIVTNCNTDGTRADGARADATRGNAPSDGAAARPRDPDNQEL